MNNYIEEWKLLCVRIEGLESLLNSFLAIEKAFLSTKKNERLECNLNYFKKIITPEFSNIFNAIRQWKEKYESFLSLEINKLVENFLKKDKYYINKDISHDWSQCVDKFGQIDNIGGSASHQIPLACQAMTSVFALKIQLNALFQNSDFKIRSITELAFAHLCRTIVVDTDVKEKWLAAKDENELACEKLGAIHLLSHGIWAFKANAEGGRTDLIYNEPLDRYMNTINRSAQGLVLTEWKKVVKGKLSTIAEEAREQMKKYSGKGGILGGIELQNTRYIILVVEKTKESLNDHNENGVCYRHVIIETNPDLPSKNNSSTIKLRSKR